MKHLLIIDDDESIREALEMLFISRGYQVSVLSSPAPLQEYLAKQTPDLILMDILMPPFNGCDICRQLKNDGCQFCILLFSATENMFDKINDCNADAFVAKPFTVSLLNATVEKLLNEKY